MGRLQASTASSATNVYTTRNLAKAKDVIGKRRRHYNAVGPNSSLSYLPPVGVCSRFFKKSRRSALVTVRSAAVCGAFLLRPVAHLYRQGQKTETTRDDHSLSVASRHDLRGCTHRWNRARKSRSGVKTTRLRALAKNRWSRNANKNASVLHRSLPQWC